MRGVRPPETVPPSVRRQWRAEREAAYEASQRRDALARMTPREKQLAAIEELHLLEEKAVDMAAAATDPARKAELETVAADLRRQAVKKERQMPQTDLEAPGKIRATFNAKVLTITSELADLSRDDGRQADFKNRRRAELTADLEAARVAADTDLRKWASQAAREAAKAGNADTREPADVMKDMAVEMRATRLAGTVAMQIEAENKLMSEARRLRSIDFRQALSYAQAAAQHGAAGASRLAAEIERDYRSSWPGHDAAAELARTVEKEVSAWQIESAAATVRANRAAIAAAKRTGDSAAESHLSDEAMHASIAAKTAAYAESQRDGTPYRDPVGPDTTPRSVQTTAVYDGDPSTTIRS